MEWAPVVAIFAILILPTYASTLIARAVAERVETRARRRAGLGESGVGGSPPKPIRAWVIFLVCPAIIILVMSFVLAITIGMTRDYGPMKPFGAAWLFTSLAMIQLAASLICASIWFDPPRGRRRCPSCWYEMPMGTELKCTECGKVAANERALHRTRRKPEFVRYAVLLMLAAPVVMRIGVWMEHGPTGLIPTTVLILGMEHLPAELIEHAPTSTVASASLLGRREREELFDWQEGLLKWNTLRILRSSTDLRTLGVAVQAIDRDWRINGSSLELAMSVEKVRFLLLNLLAADPADRGTAACVLWELGGLVANRTPTQEQWYPVAIDFSERIAPAMLDSDINVRSVATHIVMLNPPSALNVLPELVKLTETDASPRRSHARAAARTIVDLSDDLPEALRAYLEMLQSPDDQVRVTASEVGRTFLIEHPHLVHKLVPLLADSSARVRELITVWLAPEPDSLNSEDSYPMFVASSLVTAKSVPIELRVRSMRILAEYIADSNRSTTLRMSACSTFEWDAVPDDKVLSAMRSFAAEKAVGASEQEHLERIIRRHENPQNAE